MALYKVISTTTLVMSKPSSFSVVLGRLTTRTQIDDINITSG